MKIGILVEDITRRGGTERAAINLANMLATKKGYEVVLISLNNINEELPFFVRKNIKIEKKFFPNIGENKSKRIKWYLRLFSYYLNASKEYDYLIGTTHLINIFGIIFRNKKIKYISCEHANYMAISKFVRVIRRVIYKFSYKVVVLTNDDYNKYRKFLEKKKIEVIPNSLPYKTSKLSELNNNQIIVVGRLVHLKGYDILLKSLVKVFEKYDFWKLKIVGDGPEKRNLVELSEKLNISKNVVFKGEKKDILSEYLESDFLVLSSRREGFPMVLLEAMECGLPVVAFDCPTGPKEIIDDGKNGILVGYLNQEFLSESILKLIENKTMLKQMALNAKKKATQYSEKKILNKWINILEE